MAPIEKTQVEIRQRAAILTQEDIAKLFPTLNKAQQSELAGISADNRLVLLKMLNEYFPNLKPNKIRELAQAYYEEYHPLPSGQKSEQKTFEQLLKDFSLTLPPKILTAIEDDWKSNQALFVQKMKDFGLLDLASAAPKLYGTCCGLSALAIGIVATRDEYRKAKLETEQAACLKEAEDLIANAVKNGTITIAEKSKWEERTLNYYALDSNAEQRKELFGLAQAAGFALSAIEAVRSYYSSFQQSPAVVQTAKGSVQDMVERMRSVDDLSKEKLKDLLKEDSEGKKLSTEAKRKKLREDAEAMLKEEEEGKKTGKKAPEPADLEQATSIRSDMLKVAKDIDGARKDLIAKLPPDPTSKNPLDQVFRNQHFQDLFEQHRGEEVMNSKKYFDNRVVPVKVLDAVANIKPPDVAKYGPVSQLAILKAYNTALREYAQQLPKAM